MDEQPNNKMDMIKEYSEKKHRKIYKYLQRQLPDCTVKYSGVGHDISIQSQNNKKIWVEIKTCDKVICNGLDHQKMQDSNRPEVFNIHRIGRFKFDKRQLNPPLYPYLVSQHDDLVKLDGWYLFFVGKRLGKHQILFGIKAKDVKLSEKSGLKQLEWGRLSMLSHPDWFEHMKKEIYGDKN